MLTSEEKTKDIGKYQKKLTEIFKKEGVVLAYLFGSMAREKNTLLSDIDIAILFSKKVKQKDYFDKELFLATKIEKIFRIDRIDIVNLETTKSPLLKYNAVFGGKIIFVKDKNAQFEIESRIMKEYEDTAYLREAQNEIMRKQIKGGVFGKPLISPFSKYLQKYVSR